jgi:hypothetical protein
MQGWFNINKSIKVLHHINRNKKKNQVITSVNAKKAFGKIQHTIMIKALKKLGIEGMILNTIKVIYTD